MTVDQMILLLILLAALICFITERWRYDIVALLALLAATLTGIVRAETAFSGFGHAAVITVTAVLVVGRALQNSGLVDFLASYALKVGDRPTAQVFALSGVVAVLSAFMNNVGALALLLPVAVRMARTGSHPPSLLLMPLAFGSLLGGMTTLIGTPPNIIIATFRTRTNQDAFGMFDFSFVGIGVALTGILYLSIVGWRLVPRRKGQRSPEELFQIDDYVSEVRVTNDSKLIGKFLSDLEETVEHDVSIVGLIRGERRLLAPSKYETLQGGDVLMVEGDSNALKALLDKAKFELVGDKSEDGLELGSEEVDVVEAIVRPNSALIGNTIWTFQLRWRYGINLLGVAREGSRLQQRLKNIRFQAGDVLLLQGPSATLQETLSVLGCLPLAERGLRFGPRRLLLALTIFGSAIAALAAGLVTAPIALVSAAVLMVLFKLVSLREAYDSIDWPVIVMLGAMLPVGSAMDTTGAADWVAHVLLQVSAQLSPALTLALVLFAVMFLSDVVNNAAAAVLMAPVAVGVAQGMGASVDPFLMAVAIGASCAFLTPIGHQSNTLILGPGGYKFSDYFRVGLPLEILIVVVSLPLILHFWPLGI